jgi:predicted MFS family arabinose efflux permease
MTNARPASHPYYVLALLFVVLIFSLIDRYILAILLDDIKADLQVSDTAMGFVLGMAFSVVNAAAGIPLARLADHRSRKLIVAIGIGAWSLLTTAQGFARSFAALALARMGVGIGEATTTPAAHSLLADYFPPERRATAIAVYTLGGHVGLALGFAGGGLLNDTLGWRMTLVAVGLPGLLIAGLVMATLREPARGLSEARQADTERIPFGEVFRYLYTQRTFRHLAAVLPLLVFTNYAISLWGPAFLMRVHDMTASEVGVALGLTQGIAGGLGGVLGGWASDRLGRRDRRWYLWLPALAALASLPFLLGFAWLPDAWMAIACVGPTIFLISVHVAPIYALGQGLARLRMRAMASALLHLGASILAAGVGPQLIGMTNDLLEPRFAEQAVRYSLMLVAFSTLLGVFHAWRASRTLLGDLEAVRD